MEAFKNLPHYTYDDYRHWQGEWELWRGVAVAMAPSAGFAHGDFVLEIGAWIRDALKREGCKECHVTTECDWKVDEDLIIKPDITLVCGKKPKMHIERPPTLIIEVLSPATHLRDRNEKRDICDDQGVPHYLLADPEARTLHDMRSDTQPEVHDLKLHDGCSIELPSHWKPSP